MASQLQSPDQLEQSRGEQPAVQILDGLVDVGQCHHEPGWFAFDLGDGRDLGLDDHAHLLGPVRDLVVGPRHVTPVPAPGRVEHLAHDVDVALEVLRIGLAYGETRVLLHRVRDLAGLGGDLTHLVIPAVQVLGLLVAGRLYQAWIVGRVLGAHDHGWALTILDHHAHLLVGREALGPQYLVTASLLQPVFRPLKQGG